MDVSEADIQTLKAQEAKDLAIELLRQLQANERGPISPGEVQIKELDFQLRLREAEIEDRRRSEAHDQEIKQLELQIEQERTKCIQAESRANQVRDAHARVIERVDEASEALHTQLERATREHNLKVEQLEARFAECKGALADETDQLERDRSGLRDEIAELTDVRDGSLDIHQLREETDILKRQLQHEREQLDQQSATAEFEKTKAVESASRAKELELARLEAQHQKDVLARNRQAADAILAELDMVAFDKSERDALEQQLHTRREQTEAEQEDIRQDAIATLRREYNITRSESVDVTDLFYREQSARAAAAELRKQVDKLDTEIVRMREHIEQEPTRIAVAVEAAKTPVQNYIEQGAKR